ncbi:MAG: hypothetical protein HLUCCX10_15685 [Algoriphagus marincola HL-49]|uniref:Uncharacterized protein n=1 Tax=Algoriphagus marincola HL-49 TaxID=1305737 RepID=A0A0P7XST4_9BACT|nr:MAG: hypothetical protein HLUCCX10_15685 [Algoriphagus marincola HL-49]
MRSSLSEADRHEGLHALGMAVNNARFSRIVFGTDHVTAENQS